MDNTPEIDGNVARLLELWNTNLDFQSALTSARARVVEEWGIALNEKERDVLNRIDLTMEHDELDRFMRRQIG